MTAPTQLPSCPSTCQRDCPTCAEQARLIVARAAEFDQRLDQWRRHGGDRYGYADHADHAGTSDREAGCGR